MCVASTHVMDAANQGSFSSLKSDDDEEDDLTVSFVREKTTSCLTEHSRALPLVLPTYVVVLHGIVLQGSSGEKRSG